MLSKIQVFLLAIVFISLLANGYLAVQWQLCREMNDGAGYVIDIAVGKNKISRGMTYEEVVARVHHNPDVIKTNDDGTRVCSWSAMYHYGTLERLFGYYQENGHYWLDVVFDADGKVMTVSLTEA